MAQSLADMFDTALETFMDLDNASESMQSPQIQTAIKKLTSNLEEVTNLVSALDMFSKDEPLDEIPTENIRFMLLPALLGSLTIKKNEPGNRLHLINVAETYFLDFINRLKGYGLISKSAPIHNPDASEDGNSIHTSSSQIQLIAEMVNNRNTKIKRFQERKLLEEKLNSLKNHVNSPHADEEIRRDYYITLVRIFADRVMDELSFLATERPLVLMKATDEGLRALEKEKGTSVSAFKSPPIIVTRDTMQKAVYGLGYPSIPVMSVQEFYDQRSREGRWPHDARDQQSQPTGSTCRRIFEESHDNLTDQEEEEKPSEDDLEILAHQREMDEYKDSHRRGWGNRNNRS